MKIICFHDPSEEFGFLSNWYESSFTDEEGVTFSSMEQYMMYRKARLFGDIEIAQEIMEMSDPARIKAAGRRVRGFMGDIWDAHKFPLIKKGVMMKFSQNEELKEKLLAFDRDCQFAECAVGDIIWGNGVSMSDPDKDNPYKWKGENLLGKAITEVRDELAKGK